MSQRTTSPGMRVLLLAVAVTVAWVLIDRAFTWSSFIGLDFHVYRMGGQAVLDGDSSLYTRSFGEGKGSLLFTYPPFAALLFSALPLLGAGTGARVFVVLSVVVAAATSLLLTRRLGGFPAVRDVLVHPRALALAAAGTGLVCLLGPWRETMAFAQVNVLLFAIITADLLSPPGRRVPTGLLTGIAAGIKLTPLVFGLYFLARGEWKQLFTMAAGFLGTVVLGFLLLPTESTTYWLDLLRDTGRIGGAGYVDNLSVRGALLHFLGADYASTPAWFVTSLLLVAMTAWIIRDAVRRDDRLQAIAATSLLMLLISPISWSHHWVWIVLVLAVLADQVLRLPTALWPHRIAAGVLLCGTALVFLQSPKTIGVLFGAEDLNSQVTTRWLMASSAGVFCATAVLVFWVALSLAGRSPLDPPSPRRAQQRPGTAQSTAEAVRSPMAGRADPLRQRP